MESTYSRSIQDKKFNYIMSDNLKFTQYSRNSKRPGIGQSTVIYHPLNSLVKHIIYISISTIQDRVLKCQYSFPNLHSCLFLCWSVLVDESDSRVSNQNLCHQQNRGVTSLLLFIFTLFFAAHCSAYELQTASRDSLRETGILPLPGYLSLGDINWGAFHPSPAKIQRVIST